MAVAVSIHATETESGRSEDARQHQGEAHTRRVGGSVWESNPPNPTQSGHSRFEDDGSHQAPSAPLDPIAT